MSILDWCNNLDDQQGYTKAEFCWLVSLVSPDHACVDGLTFANAGYQAMASVFLPERVDMPDTYEDTGYGDNDYPLCKFYGHTPAYTSYTMDSIGILIHEVMFATDFGKVPINDAAVIAELRKHCASDNLEIYAECVMARAMAGDLVTRLEIKPVEDWYHDNWPPTWETYHKFIVAEMTFAVIGIWDEICNS